MQNSKTIINEALKLKPTEKFIIIEALIKSLDIPDPNIEIAWADEAESRLKAYKEGKLESLNIKYINS